MNIRPDLIPALQTKLAELDERQAAQNAITPDIERARAAAMRLETQIADLGRQGVEHSARAAHSDPERLSQLLAGGAVPTIDKVAEARQAKFRDLEAQCAQLRRDLEAVTRHLAELRAQDQAAAQAIAAVYRDFLIGLGEAVAEAYKHAARELVAGFVPALYSIAYRHRQVTGESNPEWFQRVIPNGLQVQWAEGEPIVDGPYNRPRPNMTVVWPRADLKLASGDPVESDAVIDDLIAAVRDSTPANSGTKPAGRKA